MIGRADLLDRPRPTRLAPSLEVGAGPAGPLATGRRHARAWAARLASTLAQPWVPLGAIAVAAAVSLWTLEQVPQARWEPALLGLLPWIFGKYVLCPLRWHALSDANLGRSWHLRVHAEGEVLGLATPGRVGAELWRVHRLEQDAGMPRSSALLEIALDRLVGAGGGLVLLLLAVLALPTAAWLPAVALAIVVAGALVALLRWRPKLLSAHSIPSAPALGLGLLLSVAHQLSVVGLWLGTLAALGAHPHPLTVLGALMASQVAAIAPGINGLSPRDGALVLALTSAGVGWQAAAGAVALNAVMSAAAALLLGGLGHAARWYPGPTRRPRPSHSAPEDLAFLARDRL